MALLLLAFITCFVVGLGAEVQEQKHLAESHERSIAYVVDAPAITNDNPPTPPYKSDPGLVDSRHSAAFNNSRVRFVPLDPLKEALSALDTMQSEFFEAWLGDWPTAIDWTAAVMNTHVVATLGSISRWNIGEDVSTGSGLAHDVHSSRENLINRYFAQTTAFYFGEEAYSLRLQAHDDMLWVVLEWLESIKFMNLHNRLHYNDFSETNDVFSRSNSGPSWHGLQFEAAFAHRAHVFYDLVNRAWDEKLCGGGLTWNPRLEPYKNAITNQLFISAAVAMYLYHPGDHNRSPFLATDEAMVVEAETNRPGLPYARAHDKRYLQTAVRAYDWLRGVNMTNEQGLYVDGYHIGHLKHNNTVCDARNEMVYTYNQGVLLSGLRGLWEGTGNVSYLSDGHSLISNVISATGWHDVHDADNTPPASEPRSSDPPQPRAATPPSSPSSSPSPSPSNFPRNDAPPPWAGLGRSGILHDLCDSTASCDQDAQAFKGIFFHHLSLFCEPLPTLATGPLLPNGTFVAGEREAWLHAQSCKGYIPWVTRNARAALATRDARGRMGMWWGAAENRRSGAGTEQGSAAMSPPMPPGAVDVCREPALARQGSNRGKARVRARVEAQASSRSIEDREWQQAGGQRQAKPHQELDKETEKENQTEKEKEKEKDYNDRGRGRTVETHSGGLAVLRALHDLITRYADIDAVRM